MLTSLRIHTNAQLTDNSATILVSPNDTGSSETNKSGSEISSTDQGSPDQPTRQNVYQDIPFANIISKDQAAMLGFL